MIPTELQTGLVTRLKDLFSDKTFNNPDMNRVSIHVFEQHLPQKEQNDINYYPYVIVQLVDGEQIGETDPEKAKIMFIVGAFDDHEDNQGHKEVIEVINKILIDLKKNPLQDMKFELQYPIRWALHDEDVAPYFFGAIETTWSEPIFIREDVEAMV